MGVMKNRLTSCVVFGASRRYAEYYEDEKAYLVSKERGLNG